VLQRAVGKDFQSEGGFKDQVDPQQNFFEQVEHKSDPASTGVRE
jgi:hypothetical protein